MKCIMFNYFLIRLKLYVNHISLIRNPGNPPVFSRKALETEVFLVQKQGCFLTNPASELGQICARYKILKNEGTFKIHE